jgi:hypothetical protein
VRCDKVIGESRVGVATCRSAGVGEPLVELADVIGLCGGTVRLAVNWVPRQLVAVFASVHIRESRFRTRVSRRA